MFTFAFLKKSELNTTVTPTDDMEVVDEPNLYPGITRIEAKHFYADGKHTFAGVVELPTPCDLLQAEAMVAESMPEQVTLDFTVINNSEACIQVISQQRFLVEATASENATVRARFMGRDVELNLIPALPGETPEEFELFIKG